MERKDDGLTAYYANMMQLLVLLVDSNRMVIEAGRGTGKTKGVTGPRTIRVAASMPGETAGFGHSTYIRLMSIIIPELISFYKSAADATGRPLMREGIDFVYGEKDLPRHFCKPRYPILHPEHSIVFANGFNIRLVSTDQPDSIAGANIVHFFFEEMKHSDGEKVRSRIFPAMRVGRLDAAGVHKSPYYGGFTGVSDTARVTLGEDAWFTRYAGQMDRQLVEDIITIALHVDKAMAAVRRGQDVERNRRVIERYRPLLDDMRRDCLFYLRVSTFINNEVLGAKFFTDQFSNLSMSEFLTSICSIHDMDYENMFFDRFSTEKHVFEDSYIYKDLMSRNIKDSFTIDSSYLKHYDPDARIILGNDPGSFASLVAAQEKKADNELRVLKEFFVYSPEDIEDMAARFDTFFRSARNRHVDLYYDRAGNKRNERRVNETDARELKAQLEARGWRVSLKNLGQATIYHWQHYYLWRRLLSNDERKVPRILVDYNECPNLISAMISCKKVPGSTPVELDKTPEKRVPLSQQAPITPQLPSALMYMVYGLYSRYLPMKNGGARADFVENQAL